MVFNPHIYALRKKIGDEVIIWPAQNGQKVFALLYGTSSFITGHRYIARRYLRALLEAEQFLKSNDAQARDILAKSMSYDAAYVEQIWPKFDFTISLEQSLLLSMEDQARFAIENGLTDEKDMPNYLDRIYFDALQASVPERISVIH